MDRFSTDDRATAAFWGAPCARAEALDAAAAAIGDKRRSALLAIKTALLTYAHAVNEVLSDADTRAKPLTEDEIEDARAVVAEVLYELAGDATAKLSDEAHAARGGI